ncbi:aldehyde ferredoxin oxidoreductase C-terminal domain-containing protein [Ammoniphilus resinae]|uniref:Aldehyde:ferredoxin oxidoreductase n=1 Tax=Ammoniphilus resinae TaxID=861532 RepID=A0ABS4GL20_9BACL|nr:aldehyde ferredoxin oxidoreductase C-terminal domain-containing protein [Ammoniphilus resinae]MBP1930919.1 aldehyde:ferredoxin oxidoreductase [Ammoniphilus resinae]
MKYLRINMSHLHYKEDDVPTDRLLLGGRALTSQLIYEEVPATCHPLGPLNKIVLANGVLTGSLASSAERTSIGAKSPLTGGIKESNAGGIAGLKMGRLGYRAIIFEGLRDDFQIVIIDKDSVRFEPADEILGLRASEAAQKLMARFGDQVSINLIGVSGEMKMNTAAVTNLDKDGSPTRFYGRGGMGAVWGSKGIKAVIIDDTGAERNKPRNRERFMDGMKNYALALREHPGTSKVYPELGTAAMVRTTNHLGALPTRNFSTGSFEHYESISGEKMRETILERGGEGSTTHACMPGCAIRCSNIYPDEEGKTVTTPIEYENIGLLGSNLGIGDLDQVVELNRLCNELCIDTIETGAALGVAMQAGIAEFGDFEAAKNMLLDLEKGNPLGRIIGGGATLVGKIYGERRVPAVKGQAMPAYEPRGIKGLGVTFATTPQGADHTAGQTIRAQVDHRSPEGQVEISYNAQHVAIVVDSLGVCFMASGPIFTKDNIKHIANLVSGYIGQDVSEEDIRAMARKCLQTEHAFNRDAGFTKAQDRLPEYMYLETNEAADTRFDVKDEELDKIGVTAAH